MNLPAANPVAARNLPGVANRDTGEAVNHRLPDTSEDRADASVAAERPQTLVIENTQVNLRFDVDKETGMRVVQVIDAASGKLVRQIPPEEILNIAKALREQKGVFISKKF